MDKKQYLVQVCFPSSFLVTALSLLLNPQHAITDLQMLSLEDFEKKASYELEQSV